MNQATDRRIMKGDVVFCSKWTGQWVVSMTLDESPTYPTEAIISSLSGQMLHVVPLSTLSLTKNPIIERIKELMRFF